MDGQLPNRNATSLAEGISSLFDYRGWKEFQWYRFVFWLSVGIVASYIALHQVVARWGDPKAAYEYHKLDDLQKQHIATIYLDPANLSATPDSLNETLQSGRLADSAMPLPADRVLSYLRNQLNFTLDTVQMDSVSHYLHQAHHAEALSFLSNLRLRVKSYFWLTGPEVYFEIMFWCWFGTLASLIFSAGWKTRNDTTFLGDPNTSFDPANIPHEFGKLIYGPLCILAILFGYNYFQGEVLADIGSSKGVLAFAFVGGLYTSRLIALLSRLKDVLLPPDPITVSTKMAAIATASKGLHEVAVTLDPDPTSLSSSLIAEVKALGMTDAVVTLNNANGANSVTAIAVKDQPFMFVAANLPAGNYHVAAQWQRLVEGISVLLTGEGTVLVNAKKTTVTLLMKIRQDT